MSSPYNQLTYFRNTETYNIFFLDPIAKTLVCLSSPEHGCIERYKHLMGITAPSRYFDLPNYAAVTKFKKALTKLDLSQVEGDVATHLVNMFPELFI